MRSRSRAERFYSYETLVDIEEECSVCLVSLSSLNCDFCSAAPLNWPRSHLLKVDGDEQPPRRHAV